MCRFFSSSSKVVSRLWNTRVPKINFPKGPGMGEVSRDSGRPRGCLSVSEECWISPLLKDKGTTERRPRRSRSTSPCKWTCRDSSGAVSVSLRSTDVGVGPCRRGHRGGCSSGKTDPWPVHTGTSTGPSKTLRLPRRRHTHFSVPRPHWSDPSTRHFTPVVVRL